MSRTSAPVPTPAVPKTRRWRVLPVLAAIISTIAVLVLVVALRTGGGAGAGELPGLPDPGSGTRWGLPVVRLLTDALGTLTVGLAVTAAFLLPGDAKLISAPAYRLLRRGAWAALGWAAASMALLALTLSDLLGVPLPAAVSASGLVSFVTSVSTGRAYAIQAGLAVAVAVGCARVLRRNAAAWTALLALVAVLVPAFTGHAAGAGNHQVAVTSLAMHVVAAALWAGGLAALLALRNADVLAGVAARYSRLALGCFAVVAFSGAANAWVRLGSLDQLWRSGYGALVLGKMVALLVLGVFGALHRRRALPALRAGHPAAFRRFAGAEVVVFAATYGLAVALSRSPTPVPSNPLSPDPTTDLLGFAMPPAPTMARMITEVVPDLFFITVATVAAGAYLAGVWRLHRRGVAWPAERTACWLAGVVVLAAATLLGVGKYAYILFSAHMAQHMVLSMVVPVLLVLGAPATLALRALRPSPDPAVRGPREWLLLALNSRLTRVLTHPVVALALVVGSLYALYFSRLFEFLMRTHLGHLAMLTHFVVTGYLFFWVVVGVDPGRRPLPHPVLVIVHFASMSFHAFFGVTLMLTSGLLAASWFGALHPAWRGPLAADQNLAAGIAWAFGEIPAAAVMVILVRQWITTDEREQRRLDRAADRADADGTEDELARYNAFLRAANARRERR
ncbi:cytochrome c oxidase assembly protein [Planosporangium mesophilum]|uniref:Copper resistance protein D n=1 Tax=Planosporangium mesophilum TaxID=689768 RepID=A0A8J3X2V2_9ACTN|nr:cytochrome c oxidase assembly protein [Planosporangium mesophilum]NJC86784.1 bifunctional copper resistance protein CopD/cytochrome c oxidase assembly protein [Planosporangium mesophilum]GII25835.1 copper resistance protein D [Planosporangium mesophilum]